MPKYTVTEVLDIIKNLTIEEKQELQSSLPSVLGIATSPTATQPIQDSSQKMQGFTISESSSVNFSQEQLYGEGTISKPTTSVQMQNADLQEALTLLEKLKQDINNSNSLTSIDKKTAEVPLQIVEEELKKPKPNKGLIDDAIQALKKGLTGILELAEPVAKVSQLIAKAWVMMP